MSSAVLQGQYFAQSGLRREAPTAPLFSQAGIAVCLLGVASGIPIQTVGRLFLGEVFLMGIAPVVVLLLLGVSGRFGKTARTILVTMALGWLGYVVSDLVRGTPSSDYMRGWSRWIAMGASFSTLAWLGSKNIGYLASFLVGLSIGYCLTPFVMGGAGAIGVKIYWKFYAGVPAIILSLIVARRFGAWVSIGTLLSLAVASIVFDSRTHALMCLLAAAVTFLAARRLGAGRLPSKTSMFAAATFMLLIIALAVYFVIAMGERYGYAQRFRNSNSTRLASATVAWSAIRESPAIGYGSWPRDSELARERDRLVAKARGSAYRSASQDELIIAHSQILQGWLEGGVLGLVFFVLLAGYLGAHLAWLGLVSPYMSLTPLIAFLQLECAWHLFFSPFSGTQRLAIPISCVFICYIGAKIHEQKAAQRFAGAMLAFPQVRPVMPG